MMEQIISDLKETINARVKSVFGGTFILFWIIVNWKFIYMIFNFDKDCSLQEKLFLMENYILKGKLWLMLIYPVLLALASIVLYSLLNHISLLVISFFSLRVKPWILKSVESKKIVEKAKFDLVMSRYSNLDIKYTAEKITFLQNQQENEDLKKQKGDNISIISDLKNEKVALIKSNADDLESVRLMLQKQIDVSEIQNAGLKNQLAGFTTLIKPGEIFHGVWQKTFTSSAGTGAEIFVIIGDKYLVDGRETFTINSAISYVGDFLCFTKTSLINGAKLIDNLVRVNETLWVGVENELTRVEYTFIRTN